MRVQLRRLARTDPVNYNDPDGLCSVMIAGINMDQFNSAGFTSFGASVGANIAYPYQAGSVIAGVVSVIAQQFSVNTATATAYATIMAAAQDSGPINIFALSGGAEAFSAAFELLPAEVKSRIGNVTYLSPAGMGGVLPSATGTTTVITGGGLDNVIVNNTPPTANYITTDCGHDAVCEIQKNAELLKSLAGSGCSNPVMISGMYTPYGSGGGSSGQGSIVQSSSGTYYRQYLMNQARLQVFLRSLPGIEVVTSTIRFGNR